MNMLQKRCSKNHWEGRAFCGGSLYKCLLTCTNTNMMSLYPVCHVLPSTRSNRSTLQTFCNPDGQHPEL